MTTGPKRARALLTIGLTVALLAGACGDDSPTGSAEVATTITADASGDAGSQTSLPGESSELTASWKGVSEDTVNVAVSLLDFEALQTMGLQDFGWGDQRLIWEFAIERLNARGGVAGRQVDAVLDFYNPALALEAEAACLRMTEDRDVFAVIGAFLGPAETATPCLTDQEDLVVFGGVMTVDLLNGAEGVWVTDNVAGRRRIPAFFELLEEAGYVNGQKVAVISGDENQSDTDEVVLPILDDLGVDVVVSAVNDAVGDDVLEEDRFWDTISQKIGAEGAEVIVINGDTTGAIRGIARNGLDQELWVVASDQLTNLGTTVDRADADGALSFGTIEAHEAWEEPAMAACVKEFTDAHPEIEVVGPLDVAEGGERWDTALILACRWIAMFEVVMNAADPELTPQSVQAAYEGLGDVSLPGYTFASWGPGKPDANDGFRLSEWDHTVGENGSLVPVTDLLDATP